MTYIVKHTFIYDGEQEFANVNEFMTYFWQGPFEDVINVVSSFLTPDELEDFKLIESCVIERSWDPATSTYTRISDFETPINYLKCRSVVESLPWFANTQLRTYNNDVLNIRKITEIL